MKFKFIILLLMLFSGVAVAQRDIPEKPNPPRLVNDLTNSTLSRAEIGRLENKLLSYEDTTSTQVAVVIVNSLNGYEVVDYAQRIGQKWGVGQANKDNGVLILVAINDRKAAIVTGYGMEGSITDAATYTIREEYMNPNFENGDFYRGLDQATDVIMKLASGEFTADQISRRRSDSDGKGFPFGVLFILFFFIFPALFGRRRGRNSMGSRSFPWWIFLLGGGGSHRHHNDWDNFRGGGGGFGGGSGGGFGGFGGGSFGGGGSGGSW